MTPIRRHLAGLAALLLAAAARAQPVAEPDFLIYTDSLVNGWQNWSFNATTASSSAFVHGGSTALAITTTAGFGALSVHCSGFDSTTYTGVSFWINGGATGGQSLQVMCRSVPVGGGNETSSSAVTFSAPLANTWQQVTIPFSSFGGALNRANLTGFWIQSRSSSAQSTFYVDDLRLVSATAPSSVAIAVNAATALRTADARIFGINTPMWDSNLNTATTAALLAEMGLRTLRYPGGSNSDSYHWATNKSDGNTWTWITGFDSFAQLAAAAGATNVIITTNYGSGTATEAADWVTYANVTKRYNHRYWEVGNEIYGSWENDTNSLPHDPTTYANRFKDYYTQMKARVPPSRSVPSSSQVRTPTPPVTPPRRSPIRAPVRPTTAGLRSCSPRSARSGSRPTSSSITNIRPILVTPACCNTRRPGPPTPPTSASSSTTISAPPPPRESSSSAPRPTAPSPTTRMASSPRA